MSATLQDIVRRYTEAHKEWDEFPSKVACQMNDTHPTIAVPELMRLLMDEHKLGWTLAWELTTQVGWAGRLGRQAGQAVSLLMQLQLLLWTATVESVPCTVQQAA